MIEQEALLDLSYGMYIVSTAYENKFYGCTIDAVVQHSFNPAILSISLNKSSYTCDILKNSKKFILSILSENAKKTTIDLFGFNTSKTHDKFSNIKYTLNENGLPILQDYISSYIECIVVDIKEIGDHIVFFGEIKNAKKLSNFKPMTYTYYYNFVKDQNIKDGGDTMKNLDFYLCEVCGKLIEVVNDGFGKLVCCNTSMRKIEPNSTEAATEKHLPVYTTSENSIEITVGSVEHPMTDEHYIKYIYVVTQNGEILKKELHSGEKPYAKFNIDTNQNIDIYAYCNLHGLWKTEVKN